MFSGALAGVLRVAAVAAVAGGLGTGIYFVAQGGDGEEDTAFQATTATTSAPSESQPLSAPDQGKEPTAPTATYPPAPITPGPQDTSDWETYASPLGFTIKYPASWLLIAPQMGGVPTGEAEILNEVRQEAVRDPVGEGSQSGDAWVQIIPALSSELSFEELLEICLRPSPESQGRRPNEGTTVTIGGLPAVRCVSEGPSLTGGQLSRAEAYWIRLSTGGLLQLIAYAIDPSTETSQIVAAMLSTLSFEP